MSSSLSYVQPQRTVITRKWRHTIHSILKLYKLLHLIGGGPIPAHFLIVFLNIIPEHHEA